MARPPIYQAMLNLPLNTKLLTPPDKEEAVEHAVKRITLRASKYRKDGFSFVVSESGGLIEIVRVPLGQNGKYWRWDAMQRGESLMFCEKPTDKDIRKVQNIIYRLHSRGGNERRWTYQVRENNLFVTCIYVGDDDLNARPLQKSVREKLEDLIARALLFREFARHSREVGARWGGAYGEFENGQADKHAAKALAIDEFVAVVKRRIAVEGDGSGLDPFRDMPAEVRVHL